MDLKIQKKSADIVEQATRVAFKDFNPRTDRMYTAWQAVFDALKEIRAAIEEVEDKLIDCALCDGTGLLKSQAIYDNKDYCRRCCGTGLVEQDD
jgi:hypothetical protein